MTAQRRFRAAHRTRLEWSTAAALAMLLALFCLAPPWPAPAADTPDDFPEIVNSFDDDVPAVPTPPRPPPVRPAAPEFTDASDPPVDVAAATTDDEDPPADPPAPPAGRGGTAFRAFSTPPAPLLTVEPEYPGMARDLGIEGRVLCAVTVDETGRVVEVTVLESAAPILDGAARAALFRWTFTPATQSGQPVAAQVVVPVLFVLR